MSLTILKDGNSGTTASITENNRLDVAAVVVSLDQLATEQGDTYNLSTSEISLTTTNESALFYIKNNTDRNLLIDNVIINIIDYVGTGGQPKLNIYRNPSAGTLISSATACLESNRNYGSNNTLDADCFEGVDGSTLTGQDSKVLVYLPSTAAITLNAFTTLTVLQKGAALGISYTPPSGMTSVTIVAAINAILNGSQL